jgi:chemotaxis methyl-accepting protein methylase
MVLAHGVLKYNAPRGVCGGREVQVWNHGESADRAGAMALRGDVITLTDGSESVGLLVECLRQAHGLDIACYSESFLSRSFERCWQGMAGMTCAGYRQLLGRDRGEAEAFVQLLNIHHSEFFRDPLLFALLEHRILPGLANAKRASDYPEIRVWSAGCAAGEEAYSIAILLSELCDRFEIPVRFRLFATDSSAQQLELAGLGSYTSSAMGNVSLRHLWRWFTRREDNYVVAPELRERVDFSLHGLLDEHSVSPSASIFGGFDLILCCNVLFYYRLDGQERILKKMRRCLAPGGYLVTGEAEREIVQAQGFQPVPGPAAIFQGVR